MKRGKIKQTLNYSEFGVKGGKEIFAEGVKAICEYSEERVRLRLCDMILCIEGAGLSMKSYYDGSVCVTGEMRGINFER